MRTRTSLAPLLALLAMACEEGGSLAYYNVEIVDTAGELPVDDGTITVIVKHDGESLECDGGPCVADIRDGDFRLDLPLASFAGMTEIRVLMNDGTQGWMGAAPPFQPGLEGIDTIGAVRVVVGRPSRCEVLRLEGIVYGEVPVLDPPRAHAAAVVRRNLVYLAGGQEVDGAADDHITQFEPLLFDTYPLRTWTDPEAIGPARGLSISEDVSLVIGDEASFVFKRNQNTAPRPERLDVHEGAGFASAVVALPTGGAVIGGRATRGVSWISAQGVADTSAQLAVERTAPAAARLHDGVLVVGGHAEGQAAAEWLRISGSGASLDLPSLPVASGGVLFPSPDRTAALWIGYQQAGLPSSSTALIRCDDDGECTAEPGPVTWDRARADFASVITAEGVLWLAGGEIGGEATTHVDLVRWEEGAPRIEAGPDLPAQSAGAVAFEHAAGIVTIAGGRDIEGRLVMCFPSALDSL